jgi:hypothetical protein
MLADTNGHGTPLAGPVGHQIAAKIAVQGADQVFIQRRSSVVTRLNTLLNAQHALREQRG